MNEAPLTPVTPDQPTTAQPTTTQPAKSPYYPYPPYPMPYPPKKDTSAKKIIYIVVAVIVILLVVGFVVILSFFGSYEPVENTQEYKFDVIVAKDGHYKYTIEEYWYDDIEIELNITSSSGDRFDIYIMSKDQYDNSYGPQNRSINAFSTLFSWENVTEVFDTVELHEGDFRVIYLVIDNTENTLTPNDANPTGTIEVEVEVIVTSEDFYYY